MRLIQLATLVMCGISLQVLSQVGIGTNAPTATLDINGNLRIRTVVQETDLGIAKDSILVISREGVVKSITSEAIYNSINRSLSKANFSSVSFLNLSLLSGSAIVLPFNNELIDLKDEYNTSSYSFNPKQNGYYRIFGTVNIAPDALLGATTSLDVALQIRNGQTVIAETSSALVGAVVGLTNVYIQPIRTVETVVYLSTSDSISFYLLNNDIAPLDIDLLTGNHAYMYIEHVR